MTLTFNRFSIHTPPITRSAPELIDELSSVFVIVIGADVDIVALADEFRAFIEFTFNVSLTSSVPFITVLFNCAIIPPKVIHNYRNNSIPLNIG